VSDAALIGLGNGSAILIHGLPEQPPPASPRAGTLSSEFPRLLADCRRGSSPTRAARYCSCFTRPSATSPSRPCSSRGPVRRPGRRRSPPHPPPERRTPTIRSVTAFFDRVLSWEQEKQAVGAHSLAETAPFRAGVGPARLIVAKCHGEAAPGLAGRLVTHEGTQVDSRAVRDSADQGE